MTEKKATLWPLGILLIIVLGIILIVISVRISSKQSIDTDKTFNMKRIDLNENINVLMQQQNAFEQVYSAHISTIGNATKSAPQMRNPYYTAPVPKTIPENEGALQGKDDIITLFLAKRDNTESMQDIRVLSAELTFVRLIEGEKEVTTLSIPMTEKTPSQYVTQPFSLPMQGFYQARFTLNIATQEAQKTQDSHDSITQPIYFYHWVFNKQAAAKGLAQTPAQESAQKEE